MLPIYLPLGRNITDKTKSMKLGFKQISKWLHLWLGLTSGIVVVIVSLTGAIYVFHEEIEDALHPWRFVEAQNRAFVPPSQLIDTAKTYVAGEKPTGLTYGNSEGAAAVGFMSIKKGETSFSVVFMNPYTGAFLKKEEPLGKGKFDFFHFVMNGHRALWLPYKIGRPIVGVATLLFLVLLITGMVMWWPKKWNKKSLKRALLIKRNANRKRLTFDLHNVLGFYSLIFACVFAVTGLIWSFEWFGDSVYFLTSGGESRVEHVHPHSDASKAHLQKNDSMPAIDRAWYQTLATEANPQWVYMTPVLHEEDDSFEITVGQIDGKFYKQNEYFYDRYSLEPLRVKGDRYAEAGFADRLSMMNYDIHTGAVLGLPGKILAFLLSLIIASSPISGFLLWKNKRGKR